MRATRQKAAAVDTGNTPRLRALDFQEAFLRGVTPEDVEEIGTKLLSMAKAGNLKAASLVLDRVLGTQSVPAWDSREQATRNAIMLDAF
jgi:hypothetical protein